VVVDFEARFRSTGNKKHIQFIIYVPKLPRGFPKHKQED